LIACKGPRTFASAFGFGSNVSSWLGPPHNQTKMTDLALPPASLAWASFGSPHAKGSEAAAVKKLRRDTPKQSCV
jgi:hypothetical protein